MNIFNGYCCFVDKDTYRQRKPSKGHNVDCLTAEIKSSGSREEGERNRHNDDKPAAQVTKKEQHDETGEKSTEPPFEQQALQRIDDIYRLVEFIRDFDICGNRGLHIGECGFNTLHNIPG